MINKAKRLEGEAVMSAPPFFSRLDKEIQSSEERMMDLPWTYGKVYRNWSRSSGLERCAGRRIRRLGAGRGNLKRRRAMPI